MPSFLDLFGMGGQDAGSQLALAAHNDAEKQQAQGPASQFDMSSLSPSNLLQGGGSLFQDTSKDNEIDPDTGLTKGYIRRENNKSLLNTGLMLMAAGISRDEGARASLLGAIPAASDSEDRLQNAAKTRLEMAKGKLAVAQATAAAQQQKAWQDYLAGIGGAAPSTTPGIAPAGGSAPMPGSAPAPAASFSPASAPAAAPAPSGAAGPVAPPPAPSPLPLPSNSLPAAIPPKMPVPAELQAGYKPTKEDVPTLATMTPQEGQKWIADRTKQLQEQEYLGQPVMAPGTNSVVIPVYKNGQLIRTENAGAGTTTASMERDKDGNTQIVTRDARGNTTNINPTELASDKNAAAATKADQEAYAEQAKAVQSNYATLQPSVDRIARIDQAIADLKAGKIKLTPGAAGAFDLGAKLGFLSPEQAQAATATGNFNALSGEISAKAAKDNNPSRVTDADQRFANEYVGLKGGPDQVLQSLQRYRNDYVQQLQSHNDDVDRLTGVASEIPGLGARSKLYKLQKVQIPDAPKDDTASSAPGGVDLAALARAEIARRRGGK